MSVVRHTCTALTGPTVPVSTRAEYVKQVVSSHWMASTYNERPGAVFVLDLNGKVAGVAAADTVFGVYLYKMGEPGTWGPFNDVPASAPWRCSVTNFYDCEHWMMRDLVRGLHLPSAENAPRDDMCVLYDAESADAEALIIDVLTWYGAERAAGAS